MADKQVSVSVKGNDEGLGKLMDELKRKADDLGVSMDRVTGFKDDKTKTENMQSIEQTMREIEKAQIGRTKVEYGDARRANYEEFEEQKRNLREKKITPEQFRKEKAKFEESNAQLSTDESNEIKEIEKNTLLELRMIRRMMLEAEKIEREKAQRDNAEFEEKKKNSFLGQLESRKKDAENDMLTAPDEEAFKKAREEYLKAKSDLDTAMGGSEGNVGGGKINGGGLFSSLIGGNVGGMLASLGGGLPLIAAIMVGINGMRNLDEYDPEYAKLNSYKLGDRRSKDNLRKNLSDFSLPTFGLFENQELSTFGISNKEFAGFSSNLVKSSGRNDSPEKIFERGFKAMLLEKGAGIENIGQYSTFERQDRYNKDIADNTLELINVMSSVRDGSIKPNDLVLLQEKLGIQQQLISNQVSRREQSDVREVNAMMAAFEMLGGSGKDQRAGDFISGVMSGAAEGGSENLMMLKWMAARKANPNATDVDIWKTIEVGQDPKYINSLLQETNRLTKPGSVNRYHAYKELFPNLTVEQRDKLMSAASDPNFVNTFLGSNYDKMANSGNVSYQDVANTAAGNTSGFSQSWMGFKQLSEDLLAVGFREELGKLMEFMSSGKMTVSLKQSPTQTPTPNKTKK